MDTSKARTDPFLKFCEFHVRFNTTVKVTTAALRALERRVEEGQFKVELAEEIAKDLSGEPWSPLMLAEPSVGVLEAIRQNACLNVVAVFSAFEDYLRGLESTAQRAGRAPRTDASGATFDDDDDARGVNAFKTRAALDIPVAALDDHGDVLRYFQMIRNCAAHRNTVASGALATLAAQSDLATQMRCLVARQEATLPPLPALEDGVAMPLLPRHAVLCAAACHYFASAMDAAFIAALGPGFLVGAAAKRAVLDPPEHLKGAIRKDAIRAIHAVLNDRYSVTGLDERETRETLDDLGLTSKVSVAWSRRVDRSR